MKKGLIKILFKILIILEMKIKRLLLTILIIYLFPLGAFAFEIKSLSLEGGPLFMLNTDDEGAPSPILPNIGIAGEIESGAGYFLPSLNISWNYYQLSEEDPEVVQPAEIEYADSLLLMNILIDFPYSMRYSVKNNLMLGWLASPALMIKVPLKAWGEGDSQRSDILGYFYGGRFIFLETGGYLLWRYSEKNSFKTSLSLYLPVYHLWDGRPFLDEMMVRLGVGFSFDLKKSNK